LERERERENHWGKYETPNVSIFVSRSSFVFRFHVQKLNLFQENVFFLENFFWLFLDFSQTRVRMYDLCVPDTSETKWDLKVINWFLSFFIAKKLFHRIQTSIVKQFNILSFRNIFLHTFDSVVNVKKQGFAVLLRFRNSDIVDDCSSWKSKQQMNCYFNWLLTMHTSNHAHTSRDNDSTTPFEIQFLNVAK